MIYVQWGSKMKIGRRQFLAGSLSFAGGLGGLHAFLSRDSIQLPVGGIVGANAKVGHLIREKRQLKPTREARYKTVIVGGGIAGLSAAWYLNKHGQRSQQNDFVLLELEGNVGGNSRWGENQISRYPWGAHYVPFPGPDAVYVRELFEDLGIIERYANGLPVFDEYALCADPHERLFFQGRWQEGLVPIRGTSDQDKLEYQDFFALIENLKQAKGRDGRPAFNIPLAQSSQDPEFLKLDRISMADFLRSKQWNSRYLNWYVNYCCRDDYGVSHERVSAWAGLHYFASRTGSAANADAQTVLTWPEGNGYLVRRLEEGIGNRIVKDSLVMRISNSQATCAAEDSRGCLAIDVLSLNDETCTRYYADHVIYCAPRMTARHIIDGYSAASPKEIPGSTPWLVANVSLNANLNAWSNEGAAVAWDNVSFYSQSLGYIVANHQDIKVNPSKQVLTYYRPLDENTVLEERKKALGRTHADWCRMILPDLEGMHPQITKYIERIDLCIWGHGMVSPQVGFLWGRERQKLQRSFGAIEFAHSEMSGVSIFEEAQYQGVEAAKRVMRKG